MVRETVVFEIEEICTGSEANFRSSGRIIEGLDSESPRKFSRYR